MTASKLPLLVEYTGSKTCQNSWTSPRLVQFHFILTFNCLRRHRYSTAASHVRLFEYNDSVSGYMWVKMCIHMYICLIIRRGSKSDISFDILPLDMQSVYHPLPFHFRKPTDASIIPSFCIWVDKFCARYLPTTVMKHSYIPMHHPPHLKVWETVLLSWMEEIGHL